ncbi:MAG: cell division FtsA domain-containing protein [Clostridium sp.]
MNGNIVCALDVGTQNIGISIGTLTNGEVDIIGSEIISSSGIEKGRIKNVDACSKQIKELFELVEKKYRHNIDRLYVGISNYGLKVIESWGSVNLKDGKVKTSDIRRAINKGKRNAIIEADDEVIDEIVNYYKLDGNITSSNVSGWIGSTLEINLTLVVVKKEVINTYRKMFNEIGCRIEGYLSNAISSRNIFFSDKGNIGTCALIDCGAGITDVSIYKNGIIKTLDSIRLGGNNITKDISICGECTFNDAEMIKKYATLKVNVVDDNEELYKVGTVQLDKSLFKDVSIARIEEIINYIDEALKKCSHYDDICSIIIYGEALSYFENINNLVKAYINKKAKIITKERLGISSNEKIVSLGLLKEALDRESLFNEDEGTNLHKSTMVNDEIKINEEVEGQSIINKIKGFLHEIF